MICLTFNTNVGTTIPSKIVLPIIDYQPSGTLLVRQKGALLVVASLILGVGSNRSTKLSSIIHGKRMTQAQPCDWLFLTFRKRVDGFVSSIFAWINNTFESSERFVRMNIYAPFRAVPDSLDFKQKFLRLCYESIYWSLKNNATLLDFRLSSSTPQSSSSLGLPETRDARSLAKSFKHKSSLHYYWPRPELPSWTLTSLKDAQLQ